MNIEYDEPGKAIHGPLGLRIDRLDDVPAEIRCEVETVMEVWDAAPPPDPQEIAFSDGSALEAEARYAFAWTCAHASQDLVRIELCSLDVLNYLRRVYAHAQEKLGGGKFERPWYFALYDLQERVPEGWLLCEALRTRLGSQTIQVGQVHGNPFEVSITLGRRLLDAVTDHGAITERQARCTLLLSRREIAPAIVAALESVAAEFPTLETAVKARFTELAEDSLRVSTAANQEEPGGGGPAEQDGPGSERVESVSEPDDNKAKSLSPSRRKDYATYDFATKHVEDDATLRDMYEWLQNCPLPDDQIPQEVKDRDLIKFKSWKSNVLEAKRYYAQRGTEPPGSGGGKSVVKQHQVEPPENEEKHPTPTDRKRLLDSLRGMYSDLFVARPGSGRDKHWAKASEILSKL
ncbi:MAG: hypothetical protein HQ582_21045, partial [Planctomycetes bacterium]|nr:hypothetical protein [Planctomycetota bacterium]